MSTLHKFLRPHRKARGLSQQKLADGIGVAFNTISGWETGARSVDLNDLEKLANFYRVHPASLLIAPENAAKVDAMRRAATIAEQLEPEVATDWIRMGERLKPPPSER
jgi:transcriptional regulator with XRE-family HTH domain